MNILLIYHISVALAMVTATKQVEVLLLFKVQPILCGKESGGICKRSSGLLVLFIFHCDL